MDILSSPAITFLPFALWITLIVVALHTLALGDNKLEPTFRSARDLLEGQLTRHDIGCEEYVDRRKALDYITAMV